MSLKEKLRTELNGVPLFSQGSNSIKTSEGGQEIRVDLMALDRLACAFDSLKLTGDPLKGASADRLKKIAELLSSKLNYLMEPISPIEIDAQGCVVQMRSSPPQKDADATTYYELLVNAEGSLQLSRYTRPKGGMRQRVSAEVTREVLLRLADDFSAAAS
jgi:hypothetical protein